MDIDNRIIANIKSLAIDMIDKAGSGHPGIVLGAAPIIYTIYAKHMNINVNDSNWINRDRFVLSAGHGSALLYATLFMAGFDLSLEDLQKFRRIGSKTPGHPEVGMTPGVDMSTGPLGQGFASSVGMALGGKILKSKYQFPKKGSFDNERSLIDYNVYVLCGDGDLMEGISYEAASLAGILNLDNLIVLYDSNNISLDGDTSNTFIENISERFKAMGWHTESVKNGTSVSEIDKAIAKAKKSGKPSLIEVKTVIGAGSVLAGTSSVHGKPLDKDDIELLKKSLSIPNAPFYVNNDAMKEFKKQISSHSNHRYEIWSRSFNEYVNEHLKGDQSRLNYLFNKRIDLNLFDLDWDFSYEKKESLRETNNKVMEIIAKYVPNFIGGSADVGSSTKAYLNKFDSVSDTNYNGRNIWFGVREHAMGAILNGLALTKFKVFGSTFFAFADYLKPAIRLAAIMDIPVIYIFTHDSINIGQDGPTHQPIEQLAMLRSTPNVFVYRPADAKELIACWQAILMINKPSALILGRNEVELLKSSSAYEASKGAYIISKERNHINGIIIATGSEVQMALYIANDLFKEESLDIRVISMPSMEIYEAQNPQYKEELLPKGNKVIVIEAGSSFGWHKYVYNDKYLITIDKFGISGTKDEVLTYCDFNYEKVKERVKKLLK